MPIIVAVDQKAQGNMQEYSGQHFQLVNNFIEGAFSIDVDDVHYVLAKQQDDFEYTWLDVSQIRLVGIVQVKV